MSDTDELRALKYRYLRTLDTKQWGQFADCFVPGATADYGGLTFGDRDSLVDYLREHVGPGVVTLHQAHHPELEVDGDEATGHWYLQDKVIVAAAGFMLEGAAFYRDRYRRTAQGWRIVHTGYRRTYEATYDLADLPGFRLRTPDLTASDLTGPDLTGPDLTGPDLTGPDLTGPDLTGPGRTTPSAPPRRPGPG